MDSELRADTGRSGSAALGTEGCGRDMCRLRPFAVLLAHAFGRVLLEHNILLIGDGLRRGWEFVSLQRVDLW